MFPTSADLLALSAKELRSRGKIEESLDATKRAVSIDTAMAQGQLMVAQLESELGRPDSALAALHRRAGARRRFRARRAFALSKGNTLYKSASGSMSSTDFASSLRMLAFADTVRSSAAVALPHRRGRARRRADDAHRRVEAAGQGGELSAHARRRRSAAARAYGVAGR